MENTIFSQLGGICNDSAKMVFTALYLMECEQTDAVKRLLKKVHHELVEAYDKARSTAEEGCSGRWVCMPGHVRDLVMRHLQQNGLSGLSPYVFWAEVFKNMPESEEASLLQLIELGMGSVKRPGLARSSDRTPWAKFIGSKQVVVGTINKFSLMQPKAPKILLKNPTVHNGSVVPVDHAWIEALYIDGFEQLRTGDLVSMSARLCLYDGGQKIELKGIENFNVLQHGRGKPFIKTSGGRSWVKVSTAGV